MNQACSHCKRSFEVTPQDRAFYKNLDVPIPTLCPDCRSRQRMSFRNERTLYNRPCDLCKKDMISIYDANRPFLVYCQDCFWSDRWDATQYAQDLNFDEPFFAQFKQLMQKVPRLSLINKQSENSEYCNYSFANKNCYMNFGSHYEEDCLYGHYSTKNKNCVDFVWLYQSEFCYECLFSKNCYRSVYLDHCENCQECYFSFDLKGCRNCLFSANLRHKEYHIFNKLYSKEEYFKKLKSLNLGDPQGLQKAVETYIKEVRYKFPMKDNYQVNCENCEGSTHENSKNLRHCFNCTKCEDCAYGMQMDETYDSMDTDFMGYDRSEKCYQAIGCSGIYNCIGCDSCWHDHDLMYCQLCFSSNNCFGCISLNKKEYHILNKPYSKKEYEKIVPQLIEHMKKPIASAVSPYQTEWGNFFPSNLSPFQYDETVAAEHFPLKSPLKKGAQKNPNDCRQCGKAFKIIPQELKFYKEMGLPLPQKCPLCRYLERYYFRRQRTLHQRSCAQCGKAIKTSYAVERREIIYCEGCYNKVVY